jgi:Cyclin, N-terminal domain
MIKSSIPLHPSNTLEVLKPKLLGDKKAPVYKNSPNRANLECDEDIEVISMPVSSFCIREAFQSIVYGIDNSECWHPSDTFYALNLLNKELEYMPNPYYLQTMQPHVSAHMRLILYDWMMEVCSELTLKRETFHLAINYVDRYLSLNPGLKKEEYQLLGLTCMYIAAKVEEIFPPHLSEWASSADNGYSVELIISMEKLILKKISYKTFPATSYNWLNWLMTQWDNFLDFHFGCVPGNSPKDFESFADKKKVKESYEERMILFKQPNQRAYKRYRETMQILDAGMLNSCSMKFMPRYIACGLMYLIISKYFYETNYSLLYYTGDCKDKSMDSIRYSENNENFDNVDPFHLESTAAVQELFSSFIKAAADIDNIEDIYASVSFFHPFLEFEAAYDLPVVCRVQTKSKIESHYEDFLAYQTHSIKNLDFLKSYMKEN